MNKILTSITTPHELLNYMSSNIEYRWMDKNGKLHDKITEEMYTTYSLMTPDEVIKNKSGICVDQTELERFWFDSHNYKYEVLNIQIFRENSAPGHIFLIYYENGIWYWFENAWYDYRGIHPYSSYEILIEDIKTKFIIQNNIAKNELNNLIIKPFIKYPYHFSYEEMDKYDNKKKK